MLERDYKDMLCALNERDVEYLIVGAHALAAHGVPRATRDLDIWVRPTRENAERVLEALRDFKAPLFDLTLEDMSAPGIVFQIGVAPVRIDILTSISGVEFDEAWASRQTATVGDLSFAVIGRDLLIANKLAAGRPKDLLDVDILQNSRSLDDDE